MGTKITKIVRHFFLVIWNLGTCIFNNRVLKIFLNSTLWKFPGNVAWFKNWYFILFKFFLASTFFKQVLLYWVTESFVQTSPPALNILSLLLLTRQKVDLFCLGVEQLPLHYRLQFHPHRHPEHALPTRLNCNPVAGKIVWKFSDQKCNGTARRRKT